MGVSCIYWHVPFVFLSFFFLSSDFDEYYSPSSPFLSFLLQYLEAFLILRARRQKRYFIFSSWASGQIIRTYCMQSECLKYMLKEQMATVQFHIWQMCYPDIAVSCQINRYIVFYICKWNLVKWEVFWVWQEFCAFSLFVCLLTFFSLKCWRHYTVIMALRRVT